MIAPVFNEKQQQLSGNFAIVNPNQFNFNLNRNQ